MAIAAHTQRSLLITFIASICLCGVIGIYLLLSGSMGWYEVRILLTTTAVSAASVLSMSSAVAWENRRWHPLGPVGILAVAAAFVLALAGIWDVPGTSGDTYWQMTGSAIVAAVALPHMALLALARLRRELEIFRLLTIVAIAALAALIWIGIWGEGSGDLLMRVIGADSILVACGTIAIPILHRISAIQTRERTVTTALSLTVTCPRCAKVQQLATGRSRCQCGLKFLIEIEEEHCPKCGYALYKATGAVCPECGTPRASAGNL